MLSLFYFKFYHKLSKSNTVKFETYSLLRYRYKELESYEI